MNLSPMKADDYRLTEHEMFLATAKQRRGKTMREIAADLNVPVSEIEKALYWDRVR